LRSCGPVACVGASPPPSTIAAGAASRIAPYAASRSVADPHAATRPPWACPTPGRPRVRTADRAKRQGYGAARSIRRMVATFDTRSKPPLAKCAGRIRRAPPKRQQPRVQAADPMDTQCGSADTTEMRHGVDCWQKLIHLLKQAASDQFLVTVHNG